MKGAWWVTQNDLDDEQTQVITQPRDVSFIVTGPPGSGKTNLLLLRANFLYLSGIKNVLIVVFTRALRDYIAMGGVSYDFPTKQVATSTQWGQEFLFEHGAEVPEATDFRTKRIATLTAIENLIDENKMGPLYDAILVDEAQDYLPKELDVFRRLADRLYLSADSNQKIYTGENCIDHAKTLVDQHCELSLHYRNGRDLCRLADALGSRWTSYTRMLEGSNYDETDRPSSVEVIECAGIEDETKNLIKRLHVQLSAYPDELVAVVVPRAGDLNAFWMAITDAGMGEIAAVHGGGIHHSFSDSTRICITTAHGAKGLESRAVNLMCAHRLTSMPHLRELTFTAVTRCKTSLVIYHSGKIPGYFNAALQTLWPVEDAPELSALFGGNG